MSTPQPNAPTTSAGPAPPVVPGPTTPLGAVQTMISLLSPPTASQGAPSSHLTTASPVEISPPMPAFALPAPPPPVPASVFVPATQVPADITLPAAASVSSHGERASPPRGTARVTRSYSALPELGLPPPRPIPVPGGDGFRRPTAHYEYSETVGQTRDEKKSSVRSSITTYVPSWPADPPAAAGASSLDQFPQGTVGARLDPTVAEAEKECDKAAKTGDDFDCRNVKLCLLTLFVRSCASVQHN